MAPTTLLFTDFGADDICVAQLEAALLGHAAAGKSTGVVAPSQS